MKDDWDIKKLGEVFEIKPPKSEAIYGLEDDDLVSFVPMEDLGLFTKEFVALKERHLKEVSGSYTCFGENDVLLAKITPCFENGKLGIARNLSNGVGFGSSEFVVYRSHGKVIPDFLFYFLSCDQIRKTGKRMMTGAVGHKRIPKEFIENLEIPYPKSLPEQQRIVAVLDEAFDAIAKAKENTEKNLQNAHDLFESYLQSIFENADNKWTRIRISDVCESIMDCVNKTAPTVNEITPFKMIRTTNVKNGKVNLDSAKYVTEGIFKSWTRRQEPRMGDIILTREAPLGEVGMLRTDDKVFLGQRLVSYRTDLSKLDNNFLLYSFQSHYLQQQIQALASGATVQHMRVPDSKALKILVPPLPEQRAIVAKLDAFSSQTKKLQAIYNQKLADLEELKKSILQKAFNGEL